MARPKRPPSVPRSRRISPRASAQLNDEGKTVSVLLVGKETAGLIAMRDEPRPDAVAGVQALKDAGITIVMLTGDNVRTAKAIGKQLGIEVRAELMPEDKLRIVKELQQQGRIVAKVGDGINDAPALAAANIAASPWAEARMWRSKRRMPPCCMAGSAISPPWSICRSAP